MGIQGKEMVLNQPLIATHDSEDFHLVMDSRPDNRPDGCIQAGTVTAGGEKRNSFHSVSIV
jgi:hypothetical protein